MGPSRTRPPEEEPRPSRGVRCAPGNWHPVLFFALCLIHLSWSVETMNSSSFQSSAVLGYLKHLTKSLCLKVNRRDLKKQ